MTLLLLLLLLMMIMMTMMMTLMWVLKGAVCVSQRVGQMMQTAQQ
jgi:hypothetical protein